MTTTREKVYEFNSTYGVFMAETPSLGDNPFLRHELIREEGIELLEAYSNDDYVEIADALGDLEYVIEGAALVYGMGELTLIKNIESDEFENEPNVFLMARIVRYTRIIKDLLSSADFSDAYKLEAINYELRATKTLVRELAIRHSIPLDEVIAVIHESNMSKLGEDGKPIYREGDNKVLKGPNYFPPTPKIKELLGVTDD